MKFMKKIMAVFDRWRKDSRVRLAITLGAVVVSAALQAYALMVFMEPTGIISGGFTGVAMLLEKVGALKGITIPMQFTMLALNIPVALMCCKGISIRFTAVSLLQVFLTSPDI